jgi:protoporphyrinogen/coproporphyrinogen III oxidase
VNPHRVAVVGGGITGLTAAWQLRANGHDVVVFEAAAACGGKLQASPFAGLSSVDEGADAFLARVPEARQLAIDIGLGDSLVSPTPGAAYVVSRGRLHTLPDGLVLGVPAGLAGLARSRLLSWPGKMRAGLDLIRPSTPPDHDSLGQLIRDRFGAEVAERLVDPLVGSINAGDADELSLAASTPQIAAVADQRSLLRALRAAPKPESGPVFQAPRAGMAALVSVLANRLRAAGGCEIRTSSAVSELAHSGAGWLVDGEAFDAVIVAAPAIDAARLLRPLSQSAAQEIADIPAAGVVMVTAAVSAASMAAVPPGSGMLVPKPEQGAVTAVSFASRKWAHWQPEGAEVLRISLGHFRHQAPLDLDDAEAADVAIGEASRHLGVQLDLVESRVTRWPGAFPQYLPHHLDRVDRIERTLRAETPGLVVTGASYRGIGVPACVRQGRSAATATSNWLLARAE